MSKRKFKINKAVRDNDAELFRQHGIVLHEYVMDDAEYVQRLKEKLVEEAAEVMEEQEHNLLIGELADVLEIIYALAHAQGIDLATIEHKRLEKRKIKGGYEKQLFGVWIEGEDGNPTIEVFKKRSEKYPEIT